MENVDARPGSRLGLTQPATYQIKVQGWLGADWTDWFDGLAISLEKERNGSPITTLTGLIVDQAALHGLLAKLYRLGLPIVSLICLDSNLGDIL